MIKPKTITQNTTYYTLALIFQKVLAFIYFTFLARGLGAEDLGKYAFAFSFTTIFSVLVDVGLSSVLTREIAKHKDNQKNILSNVLGLKIFLAVIVYLLVIALVNLLGYPELTKQLVYLTGIVMLLDNFSLTWWAVLRGHQNLKYESLGITLFQLIVVLVGGTFLFFNLNVLYLASAILIASLFNCIFSYAQMTYRLRLKPNIVLNKKTLWMLLKISIPFALAGIFARLNTQIDTVFLSKLGCANQTICDTNIGIYSIATRITLALHFIPLAFVAAVFPAMSKLFVEDKEKLKRTFEKAMRYLMLIGFPLATIVAVLAPDFVPKIFGIEYVNSVLPLQILMVTLAGIFLTFPIGSFLNATSRQVRNTFNIGVAVVINIVLNLILIPRLAYVGAAIASLASTLVILILG
ncbi:flippase, partial [Patescibacteria group bacterium]